MTHRTFLLIVALVTLCGAAFVPRSEYAHAFSDTVTHPALTQEAIAFYNLLHPDRPLTAEEAEWVIEGSAREDTPPRWVNHFYDPVYGRGWTGRLAGSVASGTVRTISELLVSPARPRAATEWVHDNDLQEAYGPYGGNRTWERGLGYYAEGNREEAFRTLGHALHLLEDLGVPDHARDDTHAHALNFATGDPGSPHEAYAERWDRASIRALAIPESLAARGEAPPQFVAVDDYFKELARYTNAYFFSRDTVNDPQYAAPAVSRDDGMFAYGRDEQGIEIPLASVERVEYADGATGEKYLLFERDTYRPIFDAWFSRAAPRIVRGGAGIIELFLKDAASRDAKKEFSAFRRTVAAPLVSVAGIAMRTFDWVKNHIAPLRDQVSSLAASVRSAFGGASSGTALLPRDGVVPPAPPISAPPISMSPPAAPRASRQSVASPKSVVAHPPTVSAPVRITPRSAASSSANSPRAMSTPKTASAPKTASTSSAVKTATTSAGATGTSGGVSSSGGSAASAGGVTSSAGGAAASAGAGTSTTNTSVPLVPRPTGIVVSEVRVAGAGDAGDEFIELYNPTGADLDLSSSSIQYISGAADTLDQIKKKNFETESSIPAHGYFLIARGLAGAGDDGYAGDVAPDLAHRTFSLSGSASGGTVFLVANQEALDRIDDPDIVDRIAYGAGNGVGEGAPAPLPAKGESIERKARYDGRCVRAFGAYEEGGNACDTDENSADFDVRAAPAPQNIQSPREPRDDFAPGPDDGSGAGGGAEGGEGGASGGTPRIARFAAEYVSSTLTVHFAWEVAGAAREASSSLVSSLELVGETASSTALILETTSTTSLTWELDEIGRDYEFALTLRDGARIVATATSSVAAPGLLRDMLVYRDPRPSTNAYLAEFVYGSVPFIPTRYSMTAAGRANWQGMVLYRNRMPDRANTFLTTNGNFEPDHKEGVMRFALERPRDALIFAVAPGLTGPGDSGLREAAFALPTEDGRFIAGFTKTPAELALDASDYFTVAYYDFSRVGGGTQDLRLVAIDDTKYFFRSEPPAHAAPRAPDALNVSFAASDRTLSLAWASSTDSDTPDGALTYEILFATSTEPLAFQWLPMGTALSTILRVTEPGSYTVIVRAVDDFGNTSSSASIVWDAPAAAFALPEQLDHAEIIGRTGGAQKVDLPATTLSAVALWVGNEGGRWCCAESYLELRRDEADAPGAFLATSTKFFLDLHWGPTEGRYRFDPAISLDAGAYWILPIASAFNDSRFYGSVTSTYAYGSWLGAPDYDAYFRLIP